MEIRLKHLSLSLKNPGTKYRLPHNMQTHTTGWHAVQETRRRRRGDEGRREKMGLGNRTRSVTCMSLSLLSPEEMPRQLIPSSLTLTFLSYIMHLLTRRRRKIRERKRERLVRRFTVSQSSTRSHKFSYYTLSPNT